MLTWTSLILLRDSCCDVGCHVNIGVIHIVEKVLAVALTVMGDNRVIIYAVSWMLAVTSLFMLF